MKKASRLVLVSLALLFACPWGWGQADFPSIDNFVTGMKAQSGFFTVYEKEEVVYGLIPATQLKKPFLLATTISGGVYSGMQWDHMMVYWEKQGKNLLLVRPDTRHRAPRTTLSDVVNRTFPSSIIRAVPIMGKGPRGGYLVDLARIFKSDLGGLSSVAPFLLEGRFYLNASLSKWSKVKVFPKNVELEVQAAFTGVKTDNASNWSDYSDSGRSYKIGIHYSISHLPSSSYKPRLADTRVGYFNTAIQDFSKKHEARTKFLRYIHRWNLKKIDPSLELSPPKEPIIFYIENTVPYRYRRYVRDGILEWNKAFEKIGFIDAVVVRQQTDSQFADLDPEDVRYNFFRWTTGDLGFAAGPSRVHPLTGQILDADIIFDDSMLRYASASYVQNSPLSMLLKSDQKLKDALAMVPEWKSLKGLEEIVKHESSQEENSWEKMAEMMSHKGRHLCLNGRLKRYQLAYANMMFRAKGDKVPEKFIGQYVKEIVMHEVGHTLGLYHNFKASSWLPLSKINSKEKPEAIVGSVMDYSPVNFAPKGTEQGNYLTQTLGPYDEWAIAYGYQQRSLRESESKMLKKITDRVAEPGLTYANDFYSSFVDPDPDVILWDLGNDKIEYAKDQLRLSKDLMKNLLEQAVDEGEDFFPLRRAFSALLFDQAYNSMLVAKYVGGQSLHWDHKGDPKARAPFVVTSSKKQREALRFLSENTFSDKHYQFSPKILNHLAPGVWWHWKSQEQNVVATFPLHETVLSFQDMTLFLMINPMNLVRMQNAVLQVNPKDNPLTIAELLTTLTDTIWSELEEKKAESSKKELEEKKEEESSTKEAAEEKKEESSAKEIEEEKKESKEKKKSKEEKKSVEEDKPVRSTDFISSFRRNLQRDHLNIWINFFALDRWFPGIPEEAKTIGWQNLRDLDKKISRALVNNPELDLASKAHLSEAQAKIRDAMKASYIK